MSEPSNHTDTNSEVTVLRPNEQTTIYEYPTGTRALGIARMEIDGRRPIDDGQAFIEYDCTFAIYVIDGAGKLWIDGDVYNLAKDDVVVVTAGRRWFMEGKITYITATTPAFYPEQTEIVDIKEML